MRVGLIVYGELDVVSGGNLYDRMLFEHLRRGGHDVEIVSLAPGSYLRHLLQNFRPGFRRRLARSGFDVVLQDELVHPSLVRLNQHLHLSCPLVAIVHHLRSSEDRPTWQNDFYRSVEARYLRTVAAFVFNSETTRESVEELLRKKTRNVVATPGGDRLDAGLSRADIEVRAREDGPLRLLFVGNLIPRKGLHVLLSALAELRDRTWHLDVVGSPGADRRYARHIERQLESLELGPKTTFHGTLDGEHLAERFREAHLLVVPSSYEGFGIVYLEAMAFGLPVIAGAAGASDEIVETESTGVRVPPEDPFTLRLQLERFLEDRELVAQFGVAALERFADHPTWEQSMERIEAFLRDVAKGSQPPEGVSRAK